MGNDSCTNLCGGKGLACGGSMAEFSPTKLETMSGIDCNDQYTEYSEKWHPGIDPSTNQCYGFKKLDEIDCHEEPKHGMKRICNCVSGGMKCFFFKK